MAETTNTRLDQAIMDLETVYGGDKELSEQSGKVNEAIEALKDLTAPYYESGKSLTEEELNNVLDGYKALMSACENYINHYDSSRSEGYEQGRLHCIKAIRSILLEDMTALNEAFALDSEHRSLLKVIQEGRSITAGLDEGQNTETVGGMLSSRLPLKLKMEDSSSEEGFFTESSYVENFGDAITAYKDSIVAQYGEDSIEKRMADSLFGGDIHELDRNIGGMAEGDVIAMLSMSKENVALYAKVPSYVGSNYDRFVELLDEDDQDVILNGREEADETRKHFMEMVHKAAAIRNSVGMNTRVAQIKAGENIEKRNVAMSNVATFLGAGDIVAKARSFTLKVGQETKTGVFQQKGKGADLDHLPKEHEIWEIVKNSEGKDYSAVDNAELKRQVSDLMVIDYICGNVDRHRGNMLYKVGTVNGKKAITGITGIDNDLSFGAKTEIKAESGERMVALENMRIMRKTTAERLLDMTPEKLELLLKDQNFNKEEMDACKKRLSDLRKKLIADINYQNSSNDRKLRKGMILVVPDDKFDDYPIEKLAATSKGDNYFGRVMGAVGELRSRYRKNDFSKPEKDIKYFDAIAEKGKLNFMDNELRTDVDIAVTERIINQANLAFSQMESRWFGRDSGHFKWMKESVEQIKAKFDEFKSTHPGQKVADLPSAEIIKMNALFRQIRLSGENYVKTHNNPWSTSGKQRLRLANVLKEMRIMNVADADNLGRKSMVNPTGIKNLLKEEFPEAGQDKLNKSMSSSRRSHSVSKSDKKLGL